MLGGHGSLIGWRQRGGLVREPVRFSTIDPTLFTANLPTTDGVVNIDDVNSFSETVSDALYKCARASRGEAVSERDDISLDRWDRLMQDRDDTRVWQAIDWKGNLQANDKSTIVPSDTEFKQFYESVMSPGHTDESSLGPVNVAVNIPLLDDPITPEEVTAQIKKIKPDKACGPDGIPPGIYKLLPVHWLLCLTTLFNCIFNSGCYPIFWTKAKLFTIFKRGERRDPKNYRGINVINGIAKLYDMVLCCRLEQWFVPYREQAGAQRGRGCLEHLVTLRLLTDYSRQKKKKLFVTFRVRPHWTRLAGRHATRDTPRDIAAFETRYFKCRWPHWPSGEV